MKTKLLIGFLILFLVAQAVQPSRNKGVARSTEDITTAVAIPGEVLAILERSCFDCHSNHTTYPWFDYITPVNWWVENHVDEGKLELNFTEFAKYSAKKQLHKLKEIKETVESGEMPLASYANIHRETRLSDAQKSTLIEWTRKASEEIRQKS